MLTVRVTNVSTWRRKAPSFTHQHNHTRHGVGAARAGALIATHGLRITLRTRPTAEQVSDCFRPHDRAPSFCYLCATPASPAPITGAGYAFYHWVDLLFLTEMPILHYLLNHFSFAGVYLQMILLFKLVPYV